MRPDIIDWLEPYIGRLLAQLFVPPYALVLIGSVLSATYIILRRLQNAGYDIIPYLSATVIGYFAMFIGGRLGYILFNLDEYMLKPIKLLMPWKGGFVSFGALGFGALVVLVYLHWRKVPFWPFADASATGAALVLSLVRIFGCFMQGCCHGKPTDWWWGVTNQSGRMAFKTQVMEGVIGADAERTLAVHPVQAVEGMIAFGLFIWLSSLWKKRRFDGQVFWSFWIAYGITRFFIEFLRGDPRLMMGAILAAQFVAFGIFGLGVYEFRRRNQSANFPA